MHRLKFEGKLPLSYPWVFSSLSCFNFISILNAFFISTCLHYLLLLSQDFINSKFIAKFMKIRKKTCLLKIFACSLKNRNFPFILYSTSLNDSESDSNSSGGEKSESSESESDSNSLAINIGSPQNNRQKRRNRFIGLSSQLGINSRSKELLELMRKKLIKKILYHVLRKIGGFSNSFAHIEQFGEIFF